GKENSGGLETLMAADRDRIVIIGGGHNGLIAAFYLAKAGLAPLVLERRSVVGGCAVTEEIHPGFRCSSLSPSTGPLLRQVIIDLQIEKQGVRFITPDLRLLLPHPDGSALRIYEDTDRTAQELSGLSARDAKAYPEFQSTLKTLGKALAPLLSIT